jgi:hypothetical protein
VEGELADDQIQVTRHWTVSDGAKTGIRAVDTLRVMQNLVFGCIRWRREWGSPAGELNKAFKIECYDRTRVVASGNVNHPKSPHEVVKWDGPHDEDYFRVSFITDVRVPDGYGDVTPDQDPYKDRNLLEVSLVAQWGTSHVTLHPPSMDLELPGRVQLLPDIAVWVH